MFITTKRCPFRPPRAAIFDRRQHNQATIDYLVKGGDAHAAWIVTVAFYKALHIVEAVLAKENPPIHKNEHQSRNKFLKTTRRYQNIWTHYSPLFQVSLVARYLSDGSSPDLMKKYLTLETIKDQILNHHLRQIAASANKLLGQDVFSTT